MINNKIPGTAAMFMAFIYAGAFVYFGAFLSFPASKAPEVVMTFLAQHQQALGLAYFLIYVVFGVLLATLVTALNEKLKREHNYVNTLATLFGKVWVGLVIASGMIATIGLSRVVELAKISNEDAYQLWTVVSMLVESLGGGNELLGGMWVLLTSIVALQLNEFGKWLNYLGAVVGITGIATVFPVDIFTELFGITQLVWFFWLGVVLFNSRIKKAAKHTIKT
ncbi:hypothetical protein [Aestuariibacter sp. GS-14]|uniref:hypothetical protein n=1 Tax=Aestuariibacter sp. GS-14 TaxID=2590670 RepID=UPI003510ED32